MLNKFSYKSTQNKGKDKEIKDAVSTLEKRLSKDEKQQLKLDKLRSLNHEELDKVLEKYDGNFEKWWDQFDATNPTDIKELDDARIIKSSMVTGDIEAHIYKANHFDVNFKQYNEL